MANQYVNKVIVNNEIKMDLTEDTITPKTLRKGFTAHDASGAPIVGNESLTDISEDGTDAGPIYELTANGWANQTQLTGKNLLPNNLESQTINDIVFTRNADGSVTVNGTASATMSPVLSTLSLNAGTYTLSGCPSDGGVDAYQLDFYYNNASQSIADTGNGISVTFNDDVTGYARIRIAKDTVVSNLTFYPQLELGSEATEYEPYCGGIPSPNPDYPQEIRVARGRNLLTGTYQKTTTQVGFRCDGNDELVNDVYYIPLKAGIYTMSLISSNNFGFLYYQYKGESYNSFNMSGNISTFELPKDGSVALWVYKNGGLSLLEISSPQLELSSKATPYVPYGFVGVEAQGKNLLNCMLSGSSVVRLNSDNSLTIFNVPSSNTSYELCNVSLVGGQTYTLSGGLNYDFRVYCTVDGVTYSSTGSPISFTPESDTTVTIRIVVTTSVTVDSTMYPQLELGSEATEYEPYYHKTIPVPLPERGWVGGLPDGTSDILKLNTAGKYEWVENTDEVVLDGTTNLFTGMVYNNGGTLYRHSSSAVTTRAKNSRSASDNINVIPTHGRAKRVALESAYEDGATMLYDAYIYMVLDGIDTAEAANAWLSQNPVTVLYPLATPQTEQGYVPNWDNTLPEHCTIDIPELRDISVRYYIDTASVEPAQRYYERANTELNQIIDDASNDATLEALAAIAPIEGDISSANYAMGSYLIHDNQLCEVTTPIATGETITVGTNVVISSVATELGELQVAVQDIIDDPYILPTMSASEKGGAKVGQGLRIDDDILSVDMSSSDATDAGPLISLQAEGWAEQTQYLGVNLLPFPYTGEDITDYGVTVTVNDDQSVTFSGSFTGSTTDFIKWPWYGEAGATNNLITPSGATSIKYITVANKSFNRMVVMTFYDSSGDEIVSYSGLQNDTSYSIPSNASGMYVYEMITKLSNTALLPFTASIMLSAGTTTYPYEPYIGGVPSPSPDYPQDIRVAKGRNLLDKRTFFTDLSAGYRTKNLQLAPNTTYVMSTTLPMNSGPAANLFVFNTSETGSTGRNGVWYGQNRTVTTGNDGIAVIGYRTDGYTDRSLEWYISHDIQLELGSVATPYVPYGYLGCEVESKNLIPNIPSTYTSGATFVSFYKVVDFNGFYLSFYFSGSFTYGGAAFMALVQTDGTTVPVTMGYMRLASDNSVPVAGTTYSHEKMTFTSVALRQCTEVRLYTNPAFTNPKFEECVLNNSNVPMNYTPYFHKTIPIPLPSKGFAAALPDGTSDILHLDGAGKWEWESKTKEYVIDGSEGTWNVHAGLASWFYKDSIITDMDYVKGASAGTAFATRFVQCAYDDIENITNGQFGFGIVAGSPTVKPKRFVFKHTDYTAGADFTTWLSQNPVTVLYPLANPTIEQGYLDNWDNNIPLHATIDIPELRNLGVECYLSEEASTLNVQWSERLRSEMSYFSTNAVTESLASLAPVENDISSANYTTGSYLIHNNQLYKVTAAIATGEAISTNTNIAPATIANELLDIDGDLLDFSELLEAAKAEYREKFQAIDSWQAAASQLIREDNGYYSNESITRMLAQRFDGKLYGYSEPKTTAVAITKTGANASLANPTLGTATVAGSSAYRHLGPFQWFAAKGMVDSDGVPHVSTIKGIDSDADWNADTNNVWSLRPIQWYSIDSTGGTVIGSLSDTWHLGLKPNPQAYLPDGTLRPYMLAPRYALGFENGVGVSKSGFKGYGRDVSHNSLITKLDYANTGYSGKTIYENWYDIFMSRMIYGTKDFQTIMQGCTAYNYQYHPSVAEQDTTRVILSNANAANLMVGSTMMMGNQATESTDRNNVNAYNIFDGLIIESITEYDANNKSIELATDTTFNTDPAYLFSTAPWYSGSCDTMDWDGSPTNPQSAKECAFFQGCELMTGTYEILANIILKGEENVRQIPYIVYSSRDDATSVTANFVKCGDDLLSNDGTATAWKYPLYIADHNGLLYGEEVGGSTAAGCADGQYVRANSVATDSEWLSVGNLGNGRNAGLSFVYAVRGLGAPGWYIWSRLSPNGLSRG